MTQTTHSERSGREAALEAILAASKLYPQLPPIELDLTGLSSADAALATAIHRTVLRRWITLEYLLNRYCKQSPRKLEPAMRAVLLTGAAQLLWLDRLPSYAVVDESVALARRYVRPKAAGMVNAVLRKIDRLIASRQPDTPWQPAPDRLPAEQGTLVLKQPILPPLDDLTEHLSAATSHPPKLIDTWLSNFGPEQTQQLCLHNLKAAPTIVAVEPDFDRQQVSSDWQPHDMDGFIVWAGDRAGLTAFLTDHPARRVQDPAATLAVESTKGLNVGRILDFCAGLGTKTRQLAAVHPEAQILACEPNPHRLVELQRLADGLDAVTVTRPEAVEPGSVDLLVLDVPCSNSGVLARRPEARYRLNRRTLIQVTDLQRQILKAALPKVRPGGLILYTTCSIEPEENTQQTQLILKRTAGELIAEKLLLPAGQGASYHDGSYHALIRLPISS